MHGDTFRASRLPENEKETLGTNLVPSALFPTKLTGSESGQSVVSKDSVFYFNLSFISFFTSLMSGKKQDIIRTVLSLLGSVTILSRGHLLISGRITVTHGGRG